MIDKHMKLHGHSSHATRGLDFLEAVAPKLGAMGERLSPQREQDGRLLKTCASAIPSYVEDLSRCYGAMIEARSFIQRVAALNPAAGEIGPGMLAQLVEDARKIVGEPE